MISDAAVEVALSLEQAVMSSLRQLQPTLAPGQNPFALFSEEDPLLVLVEDVSRSAQPARLVEKLAGWYPKEGSPAWRLICPVWPQVLSGGLCQMGGPGARVSPPPAPASRGQASSAVGGRE